MQLTNGMALPTWTKLCSSCCAGCKEDELLQLYRQQVLNSSLPYVFECLVVQVSSDNEVLQLIHRGGLITHLKGCVDVASPA
jgi:hypothetical protein